MLKGPKSSIAIFDYFTFQVCLAMFISQLVCIINTNYSRLRWCSFSSHFVVPRYPCELGSLDDDLFVDQPKNRSVANTVVTV